MSTTKVTDSMRDVTVVDATKLSGNLPAISAASLTSIPAGNLTGAVPTAALTNVDLVEGTKGADIASAGTMVIGTDGGYFDITGTTGITAMTVAAGRVFTLQFDGIVTLTHSSTLYLSGAANFTTEANDHLTFISVAANDVRQIGTGLKDGGSPVTASSEATYVQFPGTQVTSSNVNRLDDYEEGTFTIDMTAASGNNHVRTTQNGYYTKIGDVVNCSAHYVHYGTGTSSGAIKWAGFPFVGRAGSHGGTIHHGYATSISMGTAGYHLTGYINPGQSNGQIEIWNAANGTGRGQFSHITSYCTITISVTYKSTT